jgi:hypothetical protein
MGLISTAPYKSRKVRNSGATAVLAEKAMVYEGNSDYFV